METNTVPSVREMEGTRMENAQTTESTGICTALALLPPGAHLDAEALGGILGRCKVTVQRAARRGELPPAIKFMGRHVWMAGAVQEHLTGLQRTAQAHVEKRNRELLRHNV